MLYLIGKLSDCMVDPVFGPLRQAKCIKFQYNHGRYKKLLIQLFNEVLECMGRYTVEALFPIG